MVCVMVLWVVQQKFFVRREAPELQILVWFRALAVGQKLGSKGAAPPARQMRYAFWGVGWSSSGSWKAGGAGETGVCVVLVVVIEQRFFSGVRAAPERQMCASVLGLVGQQLRRAGARRRKDGDVCVCGGRRRRAAVVLCARAAPERRRCVRLWCTSPSSSSGAVCAGGAEETDAWVWLRFSRFECRLCVVFSAPARSQTQPAVARGERAASKRQPGEAYKRER